MDSYFDISVAKKINKIKCHVFYFLNNEKLSGFDECSEAQSY